MNALIADTRVPEQSTEHLLWFAEVVKRFGVDPTPLLRNVQSARNDDFWANFVLAIRLHEHGQDVDAMRYFQAAIALRPDSAISYSNLGNCLRALNRFGESIDQLQKAVGLDPTAPSIRGNLGISLAAVGRFSEALEHVEVGLRHQPDDAVFHAHAGSLLEILDRDEEALEHHQRAAELGPDTTAVREWVLSGLILAGRGNGAVSAFGSWIQRGSGGFQQWEGLAELCVFVGAKEDYAKTRTSLLEAFGKSDDPVVCEMLCRACMLAPITESEGRVAGAAIERALDRETRQPTWRAPYVKLAKAMSEYRSGRPEAALSLIDADVANVLQPVPQLVRALALADLHRDADGLASLALASMIFDWRPAAMSIHQAWMCQALRREAESKLIPKLDEFTRGTYWPTVPHERLVLIATSEDRGMHLASARLYTEAFALDPALARDIGSQCRYRAACAAARCGGKRSSDGPGITPQEQGRWRAQALQWLRADLAVLRDGSTGANRSDLLSKWRTDLDLRGVREPARLASLPENERAAFGALWTQVNGLLASTESK